MRRWAILAVVAGAAAVAAQVPPPAGPPWVYPVIRQGGGVVPPVPTAIEPPRPGLRIVVDATAEVAPNQRHRALEAAARLLNLYGQANRAGAVRVAIVLHGEATQLALHDKAYAGHFRLPGNPHLPLIRDLQRAGVEVMVCAQALAVKRFRPDEVAPGIAIAYSGLTALANRQADGWTYQPGH